MIYAGTRIYATIGPSRAALDGSGGLWLLSHGKLHHFGPDGLRREVADLAALGAPPRPSDFDLHRDGRAVLADPDTSELVRCALPRGPCQRLPARLLTLPAQPILPLNAAKVHVDDEGGRYYVSDNAGGQVVAMDFSGEVKARTKAGRLHHPNQLALVAPGRLAVVNTDNRELVTFDAGLERVLDSMPTHAPGVARRLRVLPFDSVRLPDGGIALLIAAPGMRDADLVRFDGGVPTWRAKLGDDSDPFDVELWRGKLWVSDATRYRIDAVNLDGTAAGTIEDTAFLAELGEAAKEPERWKAIRRAAQLGLVAIPLLGALLLWHGARVAKPAAPAAPVSPRKSPFEPRDRVVGPRSVVIRKVRIITHACAWLWLVLCLAMVAFILYHVPIAFFEPGHRLRGVGLAAAFLLFGIAGFSLYRAIPRMHEALRMAFDAHGVRYQAFSPMWPFALGGIEEGSAAWSDVYADDTRLLVGNRLIAYKHFLMGLLVEEEPLAELLAALPDGHKVPGGRLTSLAWHAGALRKPLITIGVVMIVGVILLEARRLL